MAGLRKARARMSHPMGSQALVNIMYLMRHLVGRRQAALKCQRGLPCQFPRLLERWNSLAVRSEERHGPQLTEECFDEAGDGEKQCGEIDEDLRDHDEDQSDEG